MNYYNFFWLFVEYCQYLYTVTSPEVVCNSLQFNPVVTLQEAEDAYRA